MSEERKLSGIVKVSVELTEKEFEEIQGVLYNSKYTLFGFIWTAIQEKLAKMKEGD